jgi:phenylacetyl-CoA:acceptor oxidoreductase
MKNNESIKNHTASKVRKGSDIAPQPKPRVETEKDGLFPTYCYMCNAGAPDVIKVRVKNGVPVNLEPNYDLSCYTPFKERGWRPCSMSMQMINRHFNPNRVKGPMKRTNPKKGKDQDPGFVEIGWDEALDLFAQKLSAVKEKGWFDDNGYYRIATCEGSDGTCPSFNGTYPVLFGGNSTCIGFPNGIFPADYTVGHGGGTKCYHTEHVFGELWNKAFTSGTDFPRCNLLLSFGKSEAVEAGTHGQIRQADARIRGMRRIQVEPVLTTTGAVSNEWIPIKPGTDAAFMYAMIHHVLHELNWREACDVNYIKWMTNNPYLVAPNGYYIRDLETKKALIWDSVDNKVKVWDDKDIKDFALDGEYAFYGCQRQTCVSASGTAC